MLRARTLLTCTAALLLLLLVAACSQKTVATLPKLVDTTPTIAGMYVGDGSTGPVLWGAFNDDDSYNEAYSDVWEYLSDGIRPDWAPAGTISAVWALSCTYGLEEGWVIPDDLGDAWDGSSVYFDGGEITFGVGTLRTYDDGTLVLSCPSDNAPSGVAVTRHFAVPGTGADGRIIVEVIAFNGLDADGFDLSDFEYYLNDGADDSSANPWQTYGSVGPFEWATKDDYDTDDPAIGVIPLLSTHFEVDFAATNGDDYYLISVDGTTLAEGERAVMAMVAGIRGGFDAGDGPGKYEAMLALGDELALLDGNAICSVGTSGFYVWAKLLDPDGELLEAICDGYDAL